MPVVDVPNHLWQTPSSAAKLAAVPLESVNCTNVHINQVQTLSETSRFNPLTLADTLILGPAKYLEKS